MAKGRSRFGFAWFSCFGGQARTKKMAEDSHPVNLHIYDLSQGMARQLSATLLGKAIEAIWHTGVVVYGQEYYFGGGIQQGQPGRTPYGTPVRAVDLGVTQVPREIFEDFLREIGPRYTPATYNLLSHNCNNFSNEAAQFLAGASVPSYILELPNEVMNSSVGALILPMIQGLETSLRAGAVPPQPPPAPASLVPAATAPQPSSSDEVAARATGAGKQEADKTVDDGNASTIPPAAPAPAAATVVHVAVERSTDKTGNNGSGSTSTVPTAVQPAAAQVSRTPAAVASEDPLLEAKRRAQEEIKREFAAIMASGTARAGEAAALATRRVMERHGLHRTAVQRG